MSNKLAIKFKLAELKSFVEDPKSYVKCIRKKQHLSIAPWCLSDLKTSIELLLNKETAKYDKSLDGILLSARNISLLSTLGSLRNDSPEIHINIEADFYVFQPTIGSTLEGVVVKKSSQFIGCLVHKVFNISIPRTNDQKKWLGNMYEIGQNVSFRVVSMDLLGKLPYIRGEIDASEMDFEAYEENQLELSEATENTESISVKKHKKKKLNEEYDEVCEINSTKKHKKKKHKHKGECNDDMEQTHIDEQKDSPKKKKSRYSNKEEHQNGIELENDTVQIIDSYDQETSPRKKKSKRNSMIDNVEQQIVTENNYIDKIIDSDNQKTSPKKKKSKYNNTIDNEEYQNGIIPKKSKINGEFKTSSISFNNDSKVKNTDIEKVNTNAEEWHSPNQKELLNQKKIKLKKGMNMDDSLSSSQNIKISNVKDKSRNSLIDELLKAAQVRTSISPEKKRRRSTSDASSNNISNEYGTGSMNDSKVDGLELNNNIKTQKKRKRKLVSEESPDKVVKKKIKYE